MAEQLLTVFTPTYNRAETLTVLYDALCRQTCKQFCWCIVDDGSQDDTQARVQRWQATGKLNIRYFFQSNQGKMAAHNLGVLKCETTLFVCVDSDDYLTERAVEIITERWQQLHENAACAGIVAYKGISEDKPLGSDFPQGMTESSLSALYASGFSGDTTLIYKTDVLKEHLFPQIEGETFITEAYIYDQIDQHYFLYVLPEILTVCEYREDGYTRNGMQLVFRNPAGWALYCLQKGNYETREWQRFKQYAWSHSYALMALGRKRPLLNIKSKGLYLLAFPLGMALYCRRMLKYWGGSRL